MEKKRTVVVNVDQIPKKLPRWDLSAAFYFGLDDPQIEIDKEALKELFRELSQYRYAIAYLEPHELSMLLRKYEEFIELSEKLMYYALCYSDTHKTDEKASNFMSQTQEKQAEYFQMLAFIHYELNSLPTWKAEEFLNHPKLGKYVPWLKRIFNSYWTLNEAAAFIIGKKSIASSSEWDNLYEETCASLRFRFGKNLLTEAEIRAKAADPENDEIRKQATIEMNRVYQKNARLFTKIYNVIMNDKRADDDLYGLEEPVEESLSHNHIYKEDFLAMVNNVVTSYIPISQRFFKLIAKMRNKPVSYIDRMANPIEAPKVKVSWPECVKKVLEAFGEFSVEYMNKAMTIVNADIIDAQPADGKKSGAYCLRGKFPYIFLNYTGKEGDVRTFAHELGHGVHHVLAAEIGVLNDSTPTCLSEVASEFAENLVFQKQLKEAENDRERLRLYIDRVSDMIASIHRQVAFCEFEERAHAARKDSALSTEQLNQIWRDEISRYMGVDCGEECAHLWMGISHLFNTPYYVYSYAFAGLVVNNLIQAYEKWDEDEKFYERGEFDELFIQMLSNTGIENFVSLLEPFGIDAESPDFWKKGLKLITKYIDEIEKLAKKEGLL